MDSDYPRPLQELLLRRRVPPGDWFADPLPPGRARRLLSDVRRALQRVYGEGEVWFEGRLLEMIARFHDGRPVESDYHNMAALAAGQSQRALLELVYGQLLMSRRLQGAMQHLDKGFEVAAHLLAPADYFEVMKRHELLRLLPLSGRPAAPRPLQGLLTEARVIRRLGGGRRGPAVTASPHNDTVD